MTIAVDMGREATNKACLKIDYTYVINTNVPLKGLFGILNTVDVLKLRTLVWQKGLDYQCRPISDCF